MQTVRTRRERSDFRLPKAAPPTDLRRADYEREAPGAAAPDGPDPAGISSNRRQRRDRIRGMGRRREGRHHPTPFGLDGPARVQGLADRCTAAARERAPLPAALLGPAPAGRRDFGLRPLLVRPGPGRARGGIHVEEGVATGLSGNPPVRAPPPRRRVPDREIVPARLGRGAAASVPRPRAGSAETVEAHGPRTCATAPAGPPTRPPSRRWCAEPPGSALPGS